MSMSASAKLDVGDRRQAAMAVSGLRPLYCALAVTGGFGVVVLALGAIFGLPLTPPTERVSLATGYHAAMPVGIGAAAYLIARLLHRKLGSERAGEGALGPVMALDLGLMALFVVACYLHFNLKMWVPLINPVRFDDLYMRSDEAMSGIVHGFMAIRTAIADVLPNIDRLYQSAFQASFILSFVYYAVLDRRYYYRYIVASILMLCLGGLAYLVAPAVGPFLYETGVNARATQAQASMWGGYQALRDGGVDWLALHGSNYFTGALAAMPSLHVGHGFVAMAYMIAARSLLAPIFVALFCWTLVESVAARWHYLIDAPVGVALALLVIWLTARLVPAPR